ncbi:MAG TPA: hypothetical protein VIM08_06820 [Arthrobacter sp.]|jgi:hypothetical protein
MDAELLTIPECPHTGAAFRLFRAALDLEGITDSLMVREIRTEDEAAALSFHGSPTFSLNGTDLFPSSAEPALACRVYPTPDGLSGQPALETLRAAIRTSRPTGWPRD